MPVYSIRYNEFNGGCTNMIKIAICDDEMTFVDKINTLISEWSAQNQYFSVIQTFSNGQNLIYDIEDGQHYDLVI